MLHAPPTAHMVQSIFSFAVAVDTLGGYNWRHRGDFSISTFNPLNGPILCQNLRKKLFNFLALGVLWGSGWILKKKGGAISISLRCPPPLQVWKLIDPCELWGGMYNLGPFLRSYKGPVCI